MSYRSRQSYDSRERYVLAPNWFCFSNFISIDGAKISRMNRRQNRVSFVNQAHMKRPLGGKREKILAFLPPSSPPPRRLLYLHKLYFSPECFILQFSPSIIVPTSLFWLSFLDSFPVAQDAGRNWTPPRTSESCSWLITRFVEIFILFFYQPFYSLLEIMRLFVRSTKNISLLE